MNAAGLGSENFAYAIVILAAGLHLILIITIVICSCCKGSCTCLDITNESVRRNANTPNTAENNVIRPSGQLPEYQERDVEALPANHTLVDSHATRTVTSWRTSFLTRVQARLGLSGPSNAPDDVPIDLPPAYGTHDFAQGHSNPVCREDEDLPPYQDYLQHVTPSYADLDSEVEDKPPLYEDVVGNKTS